jgi:hypothetical protein
MQASNLVKMVFSSGPDIRANAKLDLMPKLEENSIIKDLIHNAGKVLEIVCAEAHLTQQEILYLVFPSMGKSEDRNCMTCGTVVNLPEILYHFQCKIVQCLIKHARFGFNASEQSVYPKRSSCEKD